jgi:hypothetical protein
MFLKPFKMKISLLSILMISVSSVFAQSAFLVRNKKAPNTNIIVQNNASFGHTVAATASHQHDFMIVNTSTSPLIIQVRRFEDVMNSVGVGDAAESFFCTGLNCYPPTTSAVTETIAVGDSMVFYGDYKEASVPGYSSIRYKFTNTANTNDNLTLTLNYNQFVGLNEITKAFTHVSNIYPNPSKGEAFVNFKSEAAGQVLVKVINVLGKVVAESLESVEEGNNKVGLPTQSLTSGIYFITLGKGEAVITRKLSIK